ncbi:F-box protein At5g51370-like [Zingiber officinale]|uniref:F-box protein At5g51370-like n=1 Tax=Zingiber officinale TaxID=94328 RepID=UPI001C4BBAFF|nr:F-box protein At5g51370-like [Zingiber officinale]
MIHRLPSWTGLWFASATAASAKRPLHHALFDMRLGDQTQTLTKAPTLPCDGAGDLTLLLSDELLLRVLAAVPDSLRLPASLVCKRWLRLVGRLRRSLTLLEWSFLNTGRLPLRFPDLTDLDLVPASFASPSGSAAGAPLLTSGPVSVVVDTHADPPIGDCRFLDPDAIDRCLEIVARECPGLRKLSLVAVASETGLMAVAGGCETLQELELHRCSDLALRPISVFANLQILKLVGSVEGLYRGPGVTDIGLTILGHGCKRLVKLELSGCEGSYDGISAIGRCCLMLEELTIADHRMDAGWMTALSFCANLKTLRLQNCRSIDTDPGPLEHLGACPAMETLQIQRCQLRDRRSLQALFVVCETIRDLVLEDCWGLENDLFSLASICRRVMCLSLKGCSRVTTAGLEQIVLSCIDLQRLTVVSCNKIKDSEVSPALSSRFLYLKELKWRPDSKSVLAMSLMGMRLGRKGGRFFRRRTLWVQHRLKENEDEL